jgi:hypothetical protein
MEGGSLNVKLFSGHLAPYTLNELIRVYSPLSALIVYALFALILFTAIYTIVYLIRKYSWLLIRQEPLVYLELTFPANTSKSPYSTEQLFSQLHSLAKQKKLNSKQSYSLEIAASREKGIRYLLGATKSDVSIIEKGLLSYLPGLKIKRVSDYLPDELTNDTQITELKLKNDFAFSLNSQRKLSEHDPISYLTGNMTKLSKEELMVFQLVITPLTSFTHTTELSHISNLRRKIYQKDPLARELLNNNWRKLLSNTPLIVIKWLLQMVSFVIKFTASMVTLFLDHSGKTTPLLNTGKAHETTNNQYEEELRAEIKSKIEQPLYETSIRLLVKTDSVEESRKRRSAFLASLDALSSSYQSLVPIKRKFSLSNTGLLFKNRKLSANNDSILSISELSDIYHFPFTQTTKTEDLVKSHSHELPAPLSLKNNGDLDVIFGYNSYGGVQTEIGLTDNDRSRHMYLIGQTGSGKSTVIYHMAADDIRKGRGLCVVDPHGDLAEGLLEEVPASRLNDVIYLNPFDIKYPIGINLLELTPNLPEDEAELEKEIVCESVISILRRIFRKDENTDSHRIEYILRNAIYTAYTVPDPTIFTVYDLLNDPSFRKQVTRGLTDLNLKKFWKNEFGKAGDYQVVKMASGVTAKIGRFLFSPIAKRILEQKHSTINFDDIVDNEKILLCNLAEGKLGEDTAQLLGTAIIAKIHLAMTRRAQMDATKRKPFYLFVDEFQNFATSSFTRLLSGGRKYGLRVTIAEQSTAQQDDRNIINVILANVGTVVCFRTASPVDESLMMPQFAPLVDVGDIANLPRHHFYIRLAALEPEDAFSGVTLPIPARNDKERMTRVIEASRKNYAIVYEDTKPSMNQRPINTPNKPVTKAVTKAPLVEDEALT